MPSQSERLDIIGGGAVGQMLAYLFQEAGFPFRLIGRSGPLALRKTIRTGEKTGLLVSTIEAAPSPPALVFITTKAYDVPEVLRSHSWPVTTPVILLCNGYIEPLLRPFREAEPARVFVKGLVTRGAKPLAADGLELSAAGAISWGRKGGGETALEKSLFARAAGLVHDADACRSRKIKWYCNTVLNTLAGAYRLPSNGAALTHPDYPALNAEVHALMEELWPGEFPDAAWLRSHLDQLIRMTAGNENSMAVDIRLGRRPEIDVLSGVALSIAAYEKKFPRLAELHKKLQNQKM